MIVSAKSCSSPMRPTRCSIPAKYAEHGDHRLPLPSSARGDRREQEFEDLGEMWLRGDHYKWRCMRTFGIDEKYITGDASYYEKYMKFAEILPQLVGNPIYITI